MQSGIAESEAGRANRLQEAPDVVVRSLLGSYIAGWLFLASGGGDSAAANIDHAFRDPPLSTEQILHPEKYWDPDALDLPRDVPLPDLAAVAGSGWTRVGSGVFGELELVALVAPPLDVANIALSGGAAFTAPETSGWDGDRWAVFEHQGRVAVVWASVWDNPHDAAEFAAAANFPDSVHVEHRGDAVVALDGIEPSLRAPVAAACFALLAPAPGR